jgi:ketosteroid isomerase-like protein
MTRTPTDVVHLLLAGISEGRWAELAELYAPDAVVEIPLAVPEPTRLEGRGQVRRQFLAAAGGPMRLEAHNVVVHTTGDPEVVIAEFDYHGTVGDHAFTVANVQRLRVRDGQIVETRDYHDHLRLAAATGRLPALAAAMSAPAAPL